MFGEVLRTTAARQSALKRGCARRCTRTPPNVTERGPTATKLRCEFAENDRGFTQYFYAQVRLKILRAQKARVDSTPTPAINPKTSCTRRLARFAQRHLTDERPLKPGN